MREKAKIVMVLIEDEDKRKEERDFAMKTKDKLAKAPNGETPQSMSTTIHTADMERLFTTELLLHI